MGLGWILEGSWRGLGGSWEGLGGLGGVLEGSWRVLEGQTRFLWGSWEALGWGLGTEPDVFSIREFYLDIRFPRVGNT